MEDRESSLTEPICQSPEHGTVRGDSSVVVGFQFATETTLHVISAAPEAEGFRAALDGGLQAGVNEQEIRVLHTLGQSQRGGEHDAVIFEQQAATDEASVLAHLLPETANLRGIFEQGAHPRIGRGMELPLDRADEGHGLVHIRDRGMFRNLKPEFPGLVLDTFEMLAAALIGAGKIFFERLPADVQPRARVRDGCDGCVGRPGEVRRVEEVEEQVGAARLFEQTQAFSVERRPRRASQGRVVGQEQAGPVGERRAADEEWASAQKRRDGSPHEGWQRQWFRRDPPKCRASGGLVVKVQDEICWRAVGHDGLAEASPSVTGKRPARGQRVPVRPTDIVGASYLLDGKAA